MSTLVLRILAIEPNETLCREQNRHDSVSPASAERGRHKHVLRGKTSFFPQQVCGNWMIDIGDSLRQFLLDAGLAVFWTGSEGVIGFRDFYCRLYSLNINYNFFFEQLLVSLERKVNKTTYSKSNFLHSPFKTTPRLSKATQYYWKSSYLPMLAITE